VGLAAGFKPRRRLCVERIDAMDSLSPVELKRITHALDTRREALRAEVRAQLQGSGDDRVVGLRNRLDETDDWAVADALAELDIAGVQHTLKELAEVDAALLRIVNDTYGECADCGEPIAPARLLAYPTATRCIECQQVYEARPGRAG
jgi:RNA polymerase-binding transcription factor DksA